MSVRLDGGIIRLEGDCRAEDAETLVALVQAGPARTVELAAAGHLHAAVVQVLLALRPPVTGPAGDPFVQAWLAPLFRQAAGG